jgi:hypothetical protein
MVGGGPPARAPPPPPVHIRPESTSARTRIGRFGILPLMTHATLLAGKEHGDAEQRNR